MTRRAICVLQVDETAVYRRQRERKGLPKDIILYQYEVCPFCNKVRAFLDYHNVSHPPILLVTRFKTSDLMQEMWHAVLAKWT